MAQNLRRKSQQKVIQKKANSKIKIKLNSDAHAKKLNV